MIQGILFPMKYLNITRGVGEATHKGTYAIDNAGEDSGIDNAYAPFDGVVMKKWANGNTVWLQSSGKVRFADGAEDYAVVMLTHDNNISDLSVGQKVRQGQAFYQEGTAGQVTGNHIHMEVGKGVYRNDGWYKNSYGVWTINDKYLPYEAFFLHDTIVINGYGYPWKESDMLTDHGIDVLFRLYRGDSPSAVQRKRYVGKISFDDMSEKIQKGDEYKQEVAKAADGTLDPKTHLPTAMRAVYKPPANSFVKVEEELYRKA